MTTVGTVRELWRYPVKSMAGERLAQARLDALGIPGDRGWALRDEAAGEICGGKKLPQLMLCGARYLREPAGGAVPPAEITLPDGATVTTDDPRVTERLFALLDRTVTLPLGTYFDAFPLHLLTTASLATLGGGAPAARFDRRRFRPNVFIETPAGSTGLAEAAWAGRTLRIGDTVVAVQMGTPRCSMTVQAQRDLPKDPLVLRAIVNHADQNLGVYATVTTPGTVRVGDAVFLD